MTEELQESDVIFVGNNAEDDDRCFKCFGDSDSGESRRAKRKKVEKKTSNSVPMSIPEHFSRNSWFRCMEPCLFEYEEDGEMVPPHVIVGQRVAGKMAFSVCTGVGRTLKGRDLSEVRNSVLRMTGFLET